jgi:hypothetical protein
VQLVGREKQLPSIDHVLQAARTGFGASLVLRGEAGIGKTALLDYAVGQASDQRTVRIAGTEWEMDFAYAGLHQLTHPFLENLDTLLPTPQLRALRRAYGLDSGPEPNRFMVALAALTLLSEIASHGPLLCVLDDAHWIDEESLGALAFVARRLDADPVAMIFAAREPSDRLAILGGLPSLEVRGLDGRSARELLSRVVPGHVSRPVADRLVTETRGNPLGLIALGSELTEDQVAGGPLPDLLPLSQMVEARFTRNIHRLPPASQLLLLVAAAEATGSGDLLWLAGDRLGFGKDAARDPGINELLDFGPPIAFRHPLIRSAVYYGASTADRTVVHETLAAVIDADQDPDRWAWHLGAAAVGPDERTALALQQAAERGRSRGGFSGAATLLTRSAELTSGRKPRAGRYLAAAAAAVMAGAPLRAQGLLDLAGPGLSAPSQHAEALRVRGATLRLLFDPGATAALVAAARALLPLDVRAARDTWLAALEAEILAQRDASGASLRHVAEEALGLRVDPGLSASIPNLLLDALTTRIALGHEAAVPILREAVAMMGADDAYVNATFDSPWWMGDIACRELWDDAGRSELLARLTEACRQQGALFLLSVALLAQFERETWVGRFSLAEALFVEGRELTAGIGMDVARWDLFKVTLLGWQGRDAETRLRARRLWGTAPPCLCGSCNTRTWQRTVCGSTTACRANLPGRSARLWDADPSRLSRGWVSRWEHTDRHGRARPIVAEGASGRDTAGLGPTGALQGVARRARYCRTAPR